MARRFLIAANWKMHPPPDGWEASDSPYRTTGAVDVVVFPTALDIASVASAEHGITVGGQCGHPEASGAHTGDISMAMLVKHGCRYVLCGHSERRRDHGETDAFIATQAVAALEAGLHPIVCVGETKEERAQGKAKAIVKKQIARLPHGGITIAYEPVWAINTGVSALPRDAEEMHVFIRGLLPKESRNATRILYGGSVNDLNVKDLLREPDINGFLIGGASLKPVNFRAIVAAAATVES